MPKGKPKHLVPKKSAPKQTVLRKNGLKVLMCISLKDHLCVCICMHACVSAFACMCVCVCGVVTWACVCYDLAWKPFWAPWTWSHHIFTHFFKNQIPTSFRLLDLIPTYFWLLNLIPTSPFTPGFDHNIFWGLEFQWEFWWDKCFIFYYCRLPSNKKVPGFGSFRRGGH